MYHSRLNLSNGLLTLAVDDVTGSPLEITLAATGENIIKNHIPGEATPLRVRLADGRHLRPASRTEVQRDARLCCETAVLTADAGHFVYRALVDEESGEAVPFMAEWSVRLPAGESRIFWDCRLTGELPAERLWFPQLSGLWMGDDWTQDELLFPRHSGDRCVNPTETLSAEPARIGWDWQGYHFSPTIGGPYGSEETPGRWVREAAHSGPASMRMLILQNRAEGMVVALMGTGRTETLKGVSVATRGRTCPGVSLAITHELSGTAAESGPVSLLVEAGNWHRAAEAYRALNPRPALFPRPEWFLRSPGLVAHYDFKYQDGGIVHRFADIPALWAQARDFGLDHLLISGWHIGGFDNGFPMYRPDPDLGTEAELREAVQAVRAEGGHVAFYLNTRLFNLRYAEALGFHEAAAVRRCSGEMPVEQYGDRRFAVMCTGAAAWQAHLAQTVAYLTQDIGADGLYLDQLSMAPGQRCFNPAHTHGADSAAWNAGYNRLLETIQAEAKEPLALIFEGASDLHAHLGSGQLVTTLFTEGAFPELYRYTYPEDVLVDMMVAPAYSGMRPAHLSRRSDFLLRRAFCLGAYLWIYDLEEDNTFRRSPEKLAALRRLIALRRVWLTRYGQGRFTDEQDFTAQAAPDTLVKGFRLPGVLLLPVANPSGAEVTLRIPGLRSAVLHTADAPEETYPLPTEGEQITLRETLCFVVARTEAD